MGFASLFLGRSASRLASSMCGGGVRSISTLVNRPSLVHNPCPLRAFVSRGFAYSTAATDDGWISSEKAVLRKIDSEFYDPVVVKKGDFFGTLALSRWNNRSLGMSPPPESFPFKIEDIPGNHTVTLTREYNGERIKVVVSMPCLSDGDDDDAPSVNDGDAPSNESNDDDDHYPLVVTVTKKSGRSLEFRCRAYSDEKITIDDIHVNLPGDSSPDPKVIRDMDDTVGMEHKDLKETFKEYLKIRGLDESTFETIETYMSDKMRLEYWLWLGNVKEFLEE